ncbi:hypothetical protein FSP39_001568 [Pinctada imbricata]|uniref:Uncharacterized protein n=1 Tax=Pinctada imbricata TaxID=66713 RepID=A0AA88YK74_PINIB|nr:hypothetical protein FSP39_001568 [Pinctada imbricata]
MVLQGPATVRFEPTTYGFVVHCAKHYAANTTLDDCTETVAKKELRAKHSVPWIKHKQRKIIKRKQRLYRQAKKTKNWNNYRSFQKDCKRSLRRAEWDYVNSNIIDGLNSNNPKPFWKYVKYKRQDSGGIAPLKKGTALISDSKGKAEILLSQFKSVFTKPSKGEMPNTSKRAKSNIKPIQITTNGLEKLLKKVIPSKSSGPDNIPNRILQHCAKHLAPILQIIMQKSLDSGDLPKDWTDANISSIYKKETIILPRTTDPYH